ncbi:MAG: thiamine pyrophosphate-dependent enzyme [Acidimicrobiales bacterium]
MPYQRAQFCQVGSLAVGNRLLAPKDRTVQASPERASSLAPGHRGCRGCGEALAARYVLDAAMAATGGQVVVVNATGCLEAFSAFYPGTSWRLPWLHSLFGNAPAVASGVAAALKATGRLDVRVVAQGGDGSTGDTGFGALSGLFERNDDVLVVCYDNQAYMSTGAQRLAPSPSVVGSASTEAASPETANAFGQGKNIPAIAIAHGIPYVATASVAYVHDLEHKVARAMSFRGARYLHILAPCPLGWKSATKDTVRLARLAVESGLFVLLEAEDGEVVATTPLRHRVPVNEYLRLQGRYDHLFTGPGRRDIVARIQKIADDNVARYGLGQDNGKVFRNNPPSRF